MTIQQKINDIISTQFSPTYFDVINESHLHAGSATESHYKLVLVSAKFEGVSKVKRQQAVYKALGDIMSQIHALGLHTYTPEEWQSQQQTAPASPKCGGGH